MIQFEHVTFTYPIASRPALVDIRLHIPQGSFALVAGPSGSGKSTLLRCINGLVPHFSGGTLRGSLRVAGVDPILATPQKMSALVGFVFQDPESQFVVDRVEDEIAFALENAALPRADIGRRVEELLEVFGLSAHRRRALTALSGGERQRVAIAAALALQPPILVLDEPTSQLDPRIAEEVLRWLLLLKQSLGLTVVIAEHRLERVLPFADLMVYLPHAGDAPISGAPADVIMHMEQVPPIVAIGKALAWRPLPLTVDAAWDMGAVPARVAVRTEVQPTPEQHAARPILEATGLEVSYQTSPVLRGVDLVLYAGEIAVLLGPNGAGKTTLLRSLVGLVRRQGGEVKVEGRTTSGQPVATLCRKMGYLPQDPNHLLFADTVLDELLTTLRNHGLSTSDVPVAPELLLEQLGLLEKRDHYPRDLSTGERQRVALGAIMVTHPPVLLLDEPTRGLDYAAKHALLQILERWRSQGVAILLVTHDVEMAALAADRVFLMEEGRIVAQGMPSVVLRLLPEFTPQVAQLFPETAWLTVDDVLMELSPCKDCS